MLRSKHQAAFTLVELLAGMTILVIIMVLITRMVHNTARLTSASQGVIQADAGGREALDRIAFDLGRLILREDLPQQIGKAVGNDSLSFYAQAEGYAGDRGISRLGFRVFNGQLQRGAEGCFWSGGGTQPVVQFRAPTLPAVPAADFETLAPSVFRIELAFLMQDGTYQSARTALQGSSAAARVRAVVVAVATLEPRLRQRMSGPIDGLAALFPDAQDGADILSLWKPLLSAPQFATATADDPYPQAVRAGVRVYQRTIYLAW